MEAWNLHRRIALFIIRVIGGGPARIVLGFMVAAAFLSMWISNTATAIMMVPIGMAIITQMEVRFSTDETRNFTLGLMLGIAYACSVGGMATLVGTPPNLAFVRIFAITFPTADSVAFGTWFIMGFPLSVLMLMLIWFIVTKILFRVPKRIAVDRSIVDREYEELGAMSYEERCVLIIFFLTAVLWIFRKELDVGFVSIPGWSRLIPYPKLIDDGTVALFMSMLLFLIPTRSKDAGSPALMGPEGLKNLPWNIVLLFGGGFALAKGFQVTGLSTLIGQKFAGLQGLHPVVMILIVCFGLTFLTEVTSNTATTQMLLPILASLAIDMKVNPLLLMVPATLSASCAFMMPVATPPNAIVFGSGRIRIAEMARAGILINVIGAFLITAFFYLIGTAILSIDPNLFPDWAQQVGSGGM
jgi:sodium-dependent dicarboxylate transporter 2/3/5